MAEEKEPEIIEEEVNVLVNEKKAKRAREIVALFTSDTKNDEEVRLKEKFSALVAKKKVAKANQVEFVYRLLGGLVRTQIEHHEVLEKAKKIKEDWNKKSKGEQEKEEEI